ncbi:ABC-type Fe3+ transport system permease subunit, partial [Pseudomonas psychrotolerans]|nr:ABC-type Fe3+ transport system permease subunit [Pseudomonas psychrotolerans]
TPSTQIASVAVLQLSDRGAMNQAAAFSVCIMSTVGACLLIVRLILLLAGAKDVKLIR